VICIAIFRINLIFIKIGEGVTFGSHHIIYPFNQHHDRRRFLCKIKKMAKKTIKDAVQDMVHFLKQTLKKCNK